MEATGKIVLDEKLIRESGGKIRPFAKGDLLFEEGAHARYYFQVATGEVKTNSFSDEGKEFIHGIFTAGETFGEAPLLLDKPYPANAEALTDAEVWAVPRENFLKLLSEVPTASLALSMRLASRLYYKALMAPELSTQHPEHRLLKLIDFLKNDVAGLQASQPYIVPLTRQQLADLTGLRVETVIRAVKSLEQKGGLRIEKRKIVR